MDKLLARTERHQTLIIDAVDRPGLDHVDAGSSQSATEPADTVPAAADAQDAAGRSSTDR
ncbi:hypothetical protein OG226_49065 [Streptomyces sp. NBC_01261]|uniref:hypothetical protein n=1 Tax=Streptomyces sp. NBC_01261 TaxID=2903802 RepID=UPI002E3705AE|nr:hypothetical protein [Streptomyces sp. NBC_01261]